MKQWAFVVHGWHFEMLHPLIPKPTPSPTKITPPTKTPPVNVNNLLCFTRRWSNPLIFIHWMSSICRIESTTGRLSQWLRYKQFRDTRKTTRNIFENTNILHFKRNYHRKFQTCFWFFLYLFYSLVFFFKYQRLCSINFSGFRGS